MPNGTGPTSQPRKRLVKKFAYTETISLNNSTSEYAYLSKMMKPDFNKATGAQPQFAAYELFRVKKMKVSIQNAFRPDQGYPDGISPINQATAVTVWTAADWGMNETVSGESIMQYQNAKKNTVSVNKWTRIVDTAVRANGSMGVPGADSYSCILPYATWFNTSGFPNGNLWNNGFSGYQLFIQSFGTQNLQPQYQPSFTLVTELHVEFMQPAFQNNPSAFATRAFEILMVTQPDAADPSATRNFIFDRLTVDTVNDERVMTIRLKREDGQPGSLTFTAEELRQCIITGTSGSYYGGRPIVYDGPFPPRELPQQSLVVESL